MAKAKKTTTGNVENTAAHRPGIEESAEMAHAIFHLIEISCAVYDELGFGDADPAFTQRHLESIQIAARLGKELV